MIDNWIDASDERLDDTLQWAGKWALRLVDERCGRTDHCGDLRRYFCRRIGVEDRGTFVRAPSPRDAARAHALRNGLPLTVGTSYRIAVQDDDGADHTFDVNIVIFVYDPTTTEG